MNIGRRKNEVKGRERLRKGKETKYKATKEWKDFRQKREKD